MSENNAPDAASAIEQLLMNLMKSAGQSNKKRASAIREINIGLDDMTADTSGYDDNEIVITDKEIKVRIDFPLNNPATFVGNREGGWTLRAFVDFIIQTYKDIYAEEDRTTNIPAANVPGGLNRNTTDGKYGIYGYNLNYLTIDDAYQQEDGVWTITNSC